LSALIFISGLYAPDIVLNWLQTGYSVVSACVLALRWKDKTASQFSSRWTSAWREGVLCIITVACCGFAAGLFYRFSASFIFLVVAVVIAILATAALCCRQVSIILCLLWNVSSYYFHSL
jgi:hypothetical protein